MKPIYVALIAIASTLIGGIVGTGLGGAAGGVAGGTAGGVLGMRAGICFTVEVAKTQKLLTPAQAEQVTNQAYTKLRDTVNNKDLVPTTNPDCQTTLNEVKALGK